MRPELSLCAHLAALAKGPAPFTITPGEIFDYYDGVVASVVRCAACGACGWLWMLDWDIEQDVRVYALAAIRAEDVALYLRDVARGSCDAARFRAELDALIASAGPFERLVALDSDSRHVVAAEPLAASSAVPGGELWERLPEREDDRWFVRLGLAKGAPG
jgi:hypothetical protein